MELIVLIVAIGALVLAIGAYKAPFFESRFQVYEELITLFAQLLELNFSPAQLDKVDHLVLRGKFLFNYDQDILDILNKTREYIAYSLERDELETQPHEKETKKDHEMIRWIEQITSKHYSDVDKSELDRIFDRYLRISLIGEIPPSIKEFSLKVTEMLRQFIDKIRT